MIADVIVILILAAIVGGAAVYIVWQKKRGVKCIGCPAGEAACRKAGCGGNCGSCNGCREHNDS